MVLSKGRKIILIAAAIMIVLGIAFFAHKFYSDAQAKLDDAIDPVLGGYSFSLTDPYDTETCDQFIEEYWNPVKDKSSFKKKLVKQLQDQIIDLSFQNAGLSADERVANDFGEEVTDAQDLLLKMMPFLQKVSYEEESLKTCLTDYYLRLAENERAALDEEQADSEQEQELNTASGLMSVLEKVSEFNDAAADYYQISENEIIPIDEISQHYSKAIQLANDAGDLAIVAEALSQATGSPLLEEQSFMDSDQIADIFIADDAAVYTLRNGIGGYYDVFKMDESGVSYYGDFAARTYTTGGNKYDTSAFTPGLWAALTPGQRSEIKSGNSTRTHHDYYFHGEELDNAYSSDLPDLAQSGYGYVFCNPDGSAMFVSAKSATCYTEGGAYRIEGDFTKLVDQAAAKYNVSDDTETLDDDAIQRAVTEFLAGNYDATVDLFLSFSDNGSRLAPICEFTEQMAQSGYLSECIDLIASFLNLSDQDMAQFEQFLSELPQA